MLDITGCSDTGGGRSMAATGTLHMPLMTCVNWLATRGSTMTTEASGPRVVQMLRTASICPGPTGWRARRFELPLATDDEVTPMPNVVRVVGSSRAPRQKTATADEAAFPAPRARARPVSHAAPHTATRIRR